MASTAEIIELMNKKFNPEAASGVNITYQYEIEDSNNFYLVVSDGTCQLTEGDAADPEVKMIMSSDTLHGIMAGEIEGMMAFMSGQLRLEGDMMLATKLNQFFSN